MEVLVNYDYREGDVKALFDIEELAMFVIRSEGKPETCEASISFVTDEDIHRMNREYRGIDRPTDVLSFECDNVHDDFAVFAPAAEELYELGDIVIAPDVAERQAPEYGLSFADEMSLLITHGLLHLCGYDHMEDEEARAMESRERELLTKYWGRPFKRSNVDG
ncbi:MAG: rRNA maturation RNase YbeY [Eggerthellaceae bacterium]|nr:rRNA maturation RNase YbeY [Eggerthellaceae bacterium]